MRIERAMHVTAPSLCGLLDKDIVITKKVQVLTR